MRIDLNSDNKICQTVLSLKDGHDGAIAFISEGKLEFSIEAEKDNGFRFSEVEPRTLLKALKLCRRMPDLIAHSGWSNGHDPSGSPIGAGYSGLANIVYEEQNLMGENVINFSSSHERSHLLCAYGMSPFPQGKPCYALLWEGYFGAFYFIDENVNIRKIVSVIDHPGNRFAFLYGLADPTFQFGPGQVRLSDAGKLMAIAAYGCDSFPDEDAEYIITKLLDPSINFDQISKDRFKESPFYNIGIGHPKFADLAFKFSGRLFALFLNCAASFVQAKIPLLITGGCGLNCDWNSAWIESGMFEDVFIPPCANDSGSAIGTAIDALLHGNGIAKIQWSPYSGEYAINDIALVSGFSCEPYSAERVAALLAEGRILGWVQGRYEIGPRALGNRSILAAPFTKFNLSRLNAIKKREDFRPIAPVCLEEFMGDYFYPSNPSPFMLEFRKVISDVIPAVTHVDGSARPQSVNKHQNERLFCLLHEFRRITGCAVLCNTSLNFNGRGFINRLSDLRNYSIENGLDGFVFNDKIYLSERIAQ